MIKSLKLIFITGIMLVVFYAGVNIAVTALTKYGVDPISTLTNKIIDPMIFPF